MVPSLFFLLLIIKTLLLKLYSAISEIYFEIIEFASKYIYDQLPMDMLSFVFGYTSSFLE